MLIMNRSSAHIATFLRNFRFKGLSGEQALLAATVSKNTAAESRVRRRAMSLLLLHRGSSPDEVISITGLSSRSLVDMIQRFLTHGFCAAVLGNRASLKHQTWLTLRPSSPPRVRLQTRASVKRAIDRNIPCTISNDKDNVDFPSSTQQEIRSHLIFYPRADHSPLGGQQTTPPQA